MGASISTPAETLAPANAREIAIDNLVIQNDRCSTKYQQKGFTPPSMKTVFFNTSLYYGRTGGLRGATFSSGA